jgi:hypothetical protein
VAGLIACKDASLFEAFLCPWTLPSIFYKLLEIERPSQGGLAGKVSHYRNLGEKKYRFNRCGDATKSAAKAMRVEGTSGSESCSLLNGKEAQAQQNKVGSGKLEKEPRSLMTTIIQSSDLGHLAGSFRTGV